MPGLLAEIGPAKGGMAIVGVDWQDIAAWLEVTKSRLSPWQSYGVIQMSASYAAEYRDTLGDDKRSAPFYAVPTEESRADIESRLKAVFGSRAKAAVNNKVG